MKTILHSIFMTVLVVPLIAEPSNTLNRLATNPTDGTLLSTLRTETSSIKDENAKCHAAITYMLGCYVTGKPTDAKAVYKYLVTSFPTNDLLLLIHPEDLFQPCTKCWGKGDVTTECGHCVTGRFCTYCQGKGYLIMTGMRVNCQRCHPTQPCLWCKGTGQAITSCATCTGNGRMTSLDTVTSRYSQFLKCPLGSESDLAQYAKTNNALTTTRLLRSHSIGPEELVPLTDKKLNSLTINKQISGLLNNRMVSTKTRDGESIGSALLYPFPPGLTLTVDDVVPGVNTNAYELLCHIDKLQLTSRSLRLPPLLQFGDETLIPGGEEAIIKPVVLVPTSDSKIADLKKGSTLLSGQWILVVFIATQSTAIPTDAIVYRSFAEMETISDFSNIAKNDIRVYSITRRELPKKAQRID